MAASAAGLHALWSHAYTPGESAEPPAQWPADSALTRSAEGPTVLFFLHPRCPCSRVSVSMLEASIPATAPGVRLHVVALTGPELDATADQLTQDYARRLEADVHLDTVGAERRRFGVHTSGQVLVYDAAGHLAFAGGLTAARGHQGPNPGQAAFVALLHEKQVAPGNWPVFGCSFDGSAERTGRRP